MNQSHISSLNWNQLLSKIEDMDRSADPALLMQLFPTFNEHQLKCSIYAVQCPTTERQLQTWMRIAFSGSADAHNQTIFVQPDITDQYLCISGKVSRSVQWQFMVSLAKKGFEFVQFSEKSGDSSSFKSSKSENSLCLHLRRVHE